MSLGELTCYICDLDGTIADVTHRLHFITPPADAGPDWKKDWDSFFTMCWADPPIEHMCQLVRQLIAGGAVVLFVSGRSDQCKYATWNWLGKQFPDLKRTHLYMRKCGDRRPDDIVKGEILDRIIADGFRPMLVFDDRNSVVAMWDRRGIPCLQVRGTRGDF